MSIRIGYAPGAYDLFHVGHLNMLRHAKSQCDFLIAGVVSDEMLELTKGRRPVIPLEERLAIVSHISYVDRAVAEVVPDKLDTWESVRFNVLFKGDDWRGTAKGEKLERDFAAVGVEVVYFPYTMHTSSSMLRRVLAGIEGERDAHRGDRVTGRRSPAANSDTASNQKRDQVTRKVEVWREQFPKWIAKSYILAYPSLYPMPRSARSETSVDIRPETV